MSARRRSGGTDGCCTLIKHFYLAAEPGLNDKNLQVIISRAGLQGPCRGSETKAGQPDAFDSAHLQKEKRSSDASESLVLQLRLL